MTRVVFGTWIVSFSLLQVATSANAFPLTTAERMCAARFIKDSHKVLTAYDKATAKCAKDIGRESAVSTDPAACLSIDPQGRLSKARSRVDSGIEKNCPSTLPYPMTCPGPCSTIGAGGATSQLDDPIELAACLQCMNPAISWSGSVGLEGLHSAVLEGATLATVSTDPALAKCQAGIVKRYAQLFKFETQELSKCASDEFKSASLAAPPTDCIARAATSPKAEKAVAKIIKEITRCPVGPPFDGGVCGALAGDPDLTDCLRIATECRLCRWGASVLGASVDCDSFDDGEINSSCIDQLGATTTTLPVGTTTTTLPVGTTTTTLLVGTTTTTLLVGTTTTTTLPTDCGIFVNGWGSLGPGDGQFNEPHGLATDATGNVYVADTLNHRIQKFTSTGSFVTKWGSLGLANGRFNRPRAVAVDAAGDVYVSDSENHRVQKFTSSGTFIAAWGTLGLSNGQFDKPRGIAIGASGNVYVGDSVNDRVQFFSPTGTFLGRWGSLGQGNGEFDKPRGLTTNATGEVYVVDRSNNRIQRFTSGGIFLSTWGTFGAADGQFNLPRDVAADGVGDLYVVDGNNDRIQKFDAAGVFLTKWGSLGTGAGQFNIPRGITVGSNGLIYVSDLNNHRLQVFSCD